MTRESESWVAIPGLSLADVAVLPGILESNGIVCRVVELVDEAPTGAVLIRELDVALARRVLARYRVRTPSGHPAKIPW